MKSFQTVSTAPYIPPFPTTFITFKAKTTKPVFKTIRIKRLGYRRGERDREMAI
jgi:hypothetical protein